MCFGSGLERALGSGFRGERAVYQKARFLPAHVDGVENVHLHKPGECFALTGIEMTTAARATKQIIQTYKAVKLAEVQTQAKLDALLRTNAQYIVLEHDSTHPYFELARIGATTKIEFEALVAAIKDWPFGGSTIAEELDYVKGRQIVNDQLPDADVDALRALQATHVTESQAAQQLITVFLCASEVWSKSDPANINHALVLLHGKKLVARHKETNEQNIKPVCGAVMAEFKKLKNELKHCGSGASTIRQELEHMLAAQMANGRTDGVFEYLLK